MNNLIDELSQKNKSIYITQEIDQLNSYGKDWAVQFKPDPLAIVFPQNTNDVSDIVKWAKKNKLALVPSGGRTGLSGGAASEKKEVVVSLEKMNQILDFNEIDQSITCQAGVITKNLQDYAKEKGFYFPIDFAATGSCHIGGNVATNAGGMKVVRYGLIREWILGLKIVSGSGDVLDFNNSLVKNASGYDFRHLFIGSEGTLGIITEVSVKLTLPPLPSQVILLAVPQCNKILDIFVKFRSNFKIQAMEFFSSKALNYVLKHNSECQKPFESESDYYVLLEIETNDEEKLFNVFEECFNNEWVIDGVISQSDKQANDLWTLRENISESIAVYSPYKNDISVRISQIANFLDELNSIIIKEYPIFEVLWFGHIGDGNLHMNILKPDDLNISEFIPKCKKVDEIVFSLIKKYKGSISAEHGVGLTKKAFLNFTRSDLEINFMKQIKKIFDPDNILNPGKIFD